MNADRDSLTLPAPAKLNLFLHVTGRRPDGYHTLESLFVPIDRGDTVTLSRRNDGVVARVRGAPGVAAEDDLAVRAARLLQQTYNVEWGAAISIDKQLPMGGGVGGGSSDAATALLGLNRLWRLGLGRQALIELAHQLGADVPFFIFGRPALARGIGELLQPVSLPSTWYTVIVPNVRVSTALMFAAPELTRNSQSAKIPVFSESYGRNDVQAVAVARFPEIAGCLDALKRAAPFSGARMTGSGACVFAPFASEIAAQEALSQVMRATVDGVGITGFVARALNRHPLWSFAAR